MTVLDPRSQPALRGVFTAEVALRAGVTRRMLDGRRFARVARGVWRLSSTPVTPELTVAAVLLATSADAALSHTTALSWLLDERPSTPVHLSVHERAQTRLDDVVLHRRRHPTAPLAVRGVPCLGPERTFVDCATVLGLRRLVRAGDALVRAGLTSPARLVDYADAHHLDGVVRAREAARLVRPRVDSVRETDVRLLLVTAGLPEPETNVDVEDEHGRWVARGDLVLAAWRVVVEHDGWVHERDAAQRQKDHLRRERIQAAGWTLVVVTVEDFERPATIVWRVHTALVARGYRGPWPSFGSLWSRVRRGV
ncbi:hypothetical protein [Aeromicrobium sp. IC_218]|uniref:hypothetical protein n=1 Tax=Aeromicrobium sp. IC_218 TaxID=2545468 RepID=UPI001040614E|nr:hypothetical protein [Aeromicrobium sp. IC_218]TCI97794.1 hypothetical protein E0W78_10790 [Aeromicrobium sp. IC_218]